MKKEVYERLMKSVADIGKAVKGNKDKTALDKEKINEQIKAAVKEIREANIGEFMKTNRDDLMRELTGTLRKGEFVQINEEDVPQYAQVIEKAKDEKQKAFQEWNDDVYLMSKVLRVHPRQLKIWEQHAASHSELKKAMDTATSGEGSDWIPTGFSSQLIDRVRLALKVAALFPRINMPTNPFKLPIVLSDATAKLAAEQTADSGTKITASTPGTRNISLDAAKLAARVWFSEEMNEDSIIATMPFVKNNISVALATGLEQALIDGDTSATHQDSDVTAATDVRKAFDGLRKLCQSGDKVAMTTFNTTAVRKLRVALGKYGVDPGKCAIITGAAGYAQLLNLTEVITVDKYGAKATLLSGELAKFDGMPIIVSEQIRENLNASGVYDGTTTNNTIILMVYHPGFILGDRRKLTVKTWEDIQTDQTVVVASERHDFQPVFDETAESLVALGYDLSITL